MRFYKRKNCKLSLLRNESCKEKYRVKDSCYHGTCSIWHMAANGTQHMAGHGIWLHCHFWPHSWTLWLVKDFLSQRLLVAELLEFFTSFTKCLMLCLNRCCHNPRMHLCHNYATLMSQSKNTQLRRMGSEGAKGNILHQGWVVRSTDWHSWTSPLNRCAKCNGDELLNSWRAIKYAQTYSWGRSARKLKCVTGFTTEPLFKVEFLHEVNLLPNGACKLQCVILQNRVP